jgi:hypothetical protein
MGATGARRKDESVKESRKGRNAIGKGAIKKERWRGLS